MKLEIVGIHPFDRATPTNQGVISDEMVATSVGVTVRRVVYQDPETDIIYVYITNLPPSMSAGHGSVWKTTLKNPGCWALPCGSSRPW